MFGQSVCVGGGGVTDVGDISVDLSVSQGCPQVRIRACECLVRVSECVWVEGGMIHAGDISVDLLVAQGCPQVCFRACKCLVIFSGGVFKVCVSGGGGVMCERILLTYR